MKLISDIPYINSRLTLKISLNIPHKFSIFYHYAFYYFVYSTFAFRLQDIKVDELVTLCCFSYIQGYDYYICHYLIILEIVQIFRVISPLVIAI